MNGQNKKLNPERKIRPGLAWWIYIAKKILAVNAGGKVMKKKPAMRDLLTAGVGSVDKKDTRSRRECKTVIKKKPRTRLARRDSRLVPVAGLEPARVAPTDFESVTSANSITPA